MLDSEVHNIVPDASTKHRNYHIHYTSTFKVFVQLKTLLNEYGKRLAWAPHCNVISHSELRKNAWRSHGMLSSLRV